MASVVLSTYMHVPEGFHGDPFGQDCPHFVIIQLFRLLMDRMEQKRREGGERGLSVHSL